MGHHYVPKRYLQNFETNPGSKKVWMFGKRSAPKLVFITSVAQSPGFYADEDEVSLNEHVEKSANPVIEELIRKQQVSSEKRIALSYYLAVMLMRVPARREHAHKLAKPLMENIICETREKIQALVDKLTPEIYERRMKEIDNCERALRKRLPDLIINQIRKPWPYWPMCEAICLMQWRVTEATGPSFFLTCDNPVFFNEQDGLATKHSELWFPLSTRYALHGSFRSVTAEVTFVRASEETVKIVNRHVASRTTRFVFYHENATWIPRLLRIAEADET
jgi:hypothetical protein